jgi:ribosomal protein S12 methylthiotransferase accessory factor
MRPRDGEALLLSPVHRKAFLRAGVSSLLDAGPCDRLGIPVGLAIRPNGRVARLFDGKGLSPDAAMLAAGMEAVETAVAEQPDLPLRTASADMFLPDRVLQASQFPDLAAYRLDPGRVTVWCAGRGVLTGTRMWAPLELVGLGCRIAARHRLGLPGSSSGLAAGMTQAEAMLAACLEAVERDQLARWLDRARTLSARVPFTCARRHRAYHEVVEQCRAAYVLPVLWRIDDDLGIPTALCQLFDLGADRARPWAMTSGTASHPQAHCAARQARLEAIQVRIAMRLRHPTERPIPRSRALRREMIVRELKAALAALAASPAPPVRDLAGATSARPAALVRMLARRVLDRRGVEPVVFRLNRRDEIPAVVRVIVPGFRDCHG